MTVAYFYLRRTAARICRQTSTELRIKVFIFDNVPRPTLGCVEIIDIVLLQATLLVEPLHADSPSRQPARASKLGRFTMVTAVQSAEMTVWWPSEEARIIALRRGRV